MRHNLYIAFAAASICILPSVAMADTDYRCLKDCKREGKEYSACAQECTYTPQSSFRNYKQAAAADVHNPFTAPQPVSENALLPPLKTPSPPNEAKDYACAAKCQQSGWQFELCNKRCTKPIDISSVMDKSVTDKRDKTRNSEQQASYSLAHH